MLSWMVRWMVCRLSLLLVALALGCGDGPGRAALPGDGAAAARLIDAQTHGATEGAGVSVSAILEGLERPGVRAGWDAIAEELDAHPRLVFGVHHDARGQHEAFHRLFGPTGRPRALALELFDADGAWEGLAAESQRGDDAALAAYLDEGGPARLAEVRARLTAGAYTAWKYDLLDEVLGWVVAARGAGQRVVGCDAPPAVQSRLEGLSDDARLRLRELHCARALARLGDAPYAALFGDAHAAPDGLPRFLEGAAVVHAIGGRASDAGLEPALAPHVRVADPVLVPLEGPRVYALLLPGPHLGLARDRSRGDVDAPGIFADPPAEATLDGAPVRRAGRAIPAGDHTVVLRSEAGPRLVVAVSVPEGASARVDASPELPRVDVRVSRPR